LKAMVSEQARQDLLQLTLTDMGAEGSAVGHQDSRTWFVDFGIPGEEVLVQPEQEKRRYSTGSVREVLTASPHRVDPPCPYFGICGGCQWQHIAYEHQLELKRKLVIDQLAKRGGFESPPVTATLPSPQPYGYRNHARFSIDEEGRLGYVSRPGSGRRFMQIERCLILHPWINEALRTFQGKAAGHHQVQVRYGVHTGEYLVFPDLNAVEPSIPSGQRFYHEELLGHRFRISDSSFFQTNTLQAERMAQLVIERCQLRGEEVVVDAYAGVGTFAVLLAPRARRVIAIEESAAAVADAMVNIEGVPNIEYVRGKTEEVLGEMAERPEVLILDPPRVGCHPKALQAVVSLAPARVVYVSCDPGSLARDLRKLCDGGYQLVEVTPVDMFPQTHHIECVATLVHS